MKKHVTAAIAVGVVAASMGVSATPVAEAAEAGTLTASSQAQPPKPVLAPDGLFVGMPTRSRTVASTWLSKRLGKPTSKKKWYCDVSLADHVIYTWKNLTVYTATFRASPGERHFGWSYEKKTKGVADPLKLKTAKGVGLGSTVKQVSQAYKTKVKPVYDPWTDNPRPIRYVVEGRGKNPNTPLEFWFSSPNNSATAYRIWSSGPACGE